MKIKETTDAPYIYLSVTECKFEVIGNSYYIGMEELYDKILKWIDDEIPNLNCEMNCVFHLSVISTSSLPKIFDILTQLDSFYEKGKKIKVTWICDKDDSDNLEIAEDVLDFTEMPFDIIESD